MYIYKQTDRKTDRQKDRQTERQTDRQTDRKTDIAVDIKSLVSTAATGCSNASLDLFITAGCHKERHNIIKKLREIRN